MSIVSFLKCLFESKIEMVLQISIVSVSDAPSACAEVWNVLCTHLFSGITLLPALLFQFRIQDYYFSLFQFRIPDYLPFPISDSGLLLFSFSISDSGLPFSNPISDSGLQLFSFSISDSGLPPCPLLFPFPIWDLGLPLLFLFSIWDFEVFCCLSQFVFQPVQCSAHVLGKIFAAIWRFWLNFMPATLRQIISNWARRCLPSIWCSISQPGFLIPKSPAFYFSFRSGSNLIFSKLDQMISKRNQFNSYIFLLQN